MHTVVVSHKSYSVGRHIRFYTPGTSIGSQYYYVPCAVPARSKNTLANEQHVRWARLDKVCSWWLARVSAARATNTARTYTLTYLVSICVNVAQFRELELQLRILLL